MADRYRADYPEHEEFLDEIENSGATKLRLRQIDRLASIVHRNEPFTPDQEVEEVLRQTRQLDDSVTEVDEFTVYRNVA